MVVVLTVWAGWGGGGGRRDVMKRVHVDDASGEAGGLMAFGTGCVGVVFAFRFLIPRICAGVGLNSGGGGKDDIGVYFIARGGGGGGGLNADILWKAENAAWVVLPLKQAGLHAKKKSRTCSKTNRNCCKTNQTCSKTGGTCSKACGTYFKTFTTCSGNGQDLFQKGVVWSHPGAWSRHHYLPDHQAEQSDCPGQVDYQQPPDLTGALVSRRQN